MFKYYKTYHGASECEEITYQEALDTLSTTWKLTDVIIDMLSCANRIWCRCSMIDVIEERRDGYPLSIIPGICCVAPIYYTYTDDGERAIPDHGDDVTQFVSDLIFYDSTAPEPITIEDAEDNISEWTKEGVELPDGLTPEILMIEWNGHIHADRT